ncbi:MULTISPECIES: hypothetical protein [unclassified Bacillus (in: firmicutes)]|uniref:hypothetical protein n=1 Tax=unclassified Bacillus (in: firmicutes) TaxID=185979 RepID=UPI0004E19EAD|nr:MULTISPECIES: hypothetical protein [unclassified Bacillus (in: firmicutes)]
MNKPYTNVDFKKFLKEKELKNVKLSDLEEIIEKEGLEVWELASFNEIYHLVSTRESNNTLKTLSWVIAALAVVTTVSAIIGIFG